MKHTHTSQKIGPLFTVCLIFIALTAHGQQLTALVNEALRNNPQIQKFEVQYKIATDKVNEVNTLPDTDFELGYYVSKPETRTGAQRLNVSVKQMLPWFGTITARENYASALADAQYEEVTIAKRKLAASVSQSYYNLYVNKAKEKILLENIALLKTYETFALTSVEVGTASAVDVLRLTIRQNEIEQLRQVLQQQYLAEQTTLNKLLNRDKTVPIDVVNELLIPTEENKLINIKNLAIHPELTQYDKLYESIAQSELLNQKERKPSIGFGFNYVAVSERPNTSFNDNGKDIALPFASVSIPIFNNKYSSKTKQHTLKQQEIIFQKQERLNVLETLLEKAIRDRSSAIISYNTHTKNLLQADHAKDILIKSYETGTIDFNDVLDIQELQLKIQIDQIEAIKAYYIQTTIINYLSN